MIPFKIKLLTETAKAPTQENEGDLWDLYADDFCGEKLKDIHYKEEAMYNYDITHKQNLNFEDHLDCFDRNHLPDGLPNECKLYSQGRILVKTGISLELPIKYSKRQRIGKAKKDFNTNEILYLLEEWSYKKKYNNKICSHVEAYAVADIRPRSGLALKHGITVLNTPGTIDNSYRKEIGVILYNAGHEPYTITKGDKIAQMLIRPLYLSKMEIVKNIEDTGRGGYGSTGK
jgi:dUTPase